MVETNDDVGILRIVTAAKGRDDTCAVLSQCEVCGCQRNARNGVIYIVQNFYSDVRKAIYNRIGRNEGKPLSEGGKRKKPEKEKKIYCEFMGHYKVLR
jgi:hypothetical protein